MPQPHALRSSGSVTQLIADLKNGQAGAAQQELWNRYFRRLMASLADERLRQIARRKLEGYTNAEIAAELGVVERTIQRKMGVIRAA